MVMKGMKLVIMVTISITASCFEENCQEIIMTERTIAEEISGIKTCLFALPYGDFNNTTPAANSLI